MLLPQCIHVLNDLDGVVEKFWLRINISVPICYHVPDTMMNAANARAYCQSQGGDLIILDTWYKNDDFANIYYKGLQLNEDIWIGLKNEHINVSLIIPKWINNEAVTYSNYATNQPKSSIQDCYVMQRNDTYGWYNDECNTVRYFACERGNKSVIVVIFSFLC